MMTLPDSGQTKDVSKNGQGDGVEADADGVERADPVTVSLAEQVIERFGGIRPMASKLSVPVTTVQGWKKRGAIPPTRLNDLREAANRYSIRLTEEELARLASGEDRGGDLAGTGLAGPKLAPPKLDSAGGAPAAALSSAPGRAQAEAAEAAEAAPTGKAAAGQPEAAEPAPAPARPASAPSGKPAQRPGEAKEIGPIETAAEIPPIEIPRFEIPPAEVPIGTAASANGGAAARSAGPAEARGPQSQPQPVGVAAEAGAGFEPGTGVAGEQAGTSRQGSFSTWAGISLLAALLALICAVIAIWLATTGGGEIRGLTGSRDLERRVSEVETKVTRVALEQVAAQTSLEQRINSVDGRIDDASERTAATAARLADRITALEETIPELNKKIVSMPMGSPTLAKILAAAQLRSALEKPTPFQSELAAVRIASLSNPRVTQALEQIQDRASTGIATETWLTIRFPAFSQAIIDASTAGDPIGQMVDGVSGLIEYYAPPLYRFAGYASGDSARAIVARAEKALRAGNFQAAIDELSRLRGAAALEAEPWLAEARARLAANGVRTILNNHMIALAAAGPQAE